jgi:alanine dehydrogenase
MPKCVRERFVSKRPASKNAKRRVVSKAKAATANKAKGKLAGPLYLTEADVQRLASVEDAIATLQRLFETWSDPATVNLPRQRAQISNGAFNLMGAAWGASEIFGLKNYFSGTGGRFQVLLYSSRDGALKAMLEADHLGRMRTGAASGLAAKLLANPEARVLGVIGAGRQALTQVAGVCAVRKIEIVRVFARTAEHRDSLAKQIERTVGVAAEPATSAEAAVSDAHIVATVTTSVEPVLRANWLKSGVHVNAVGAVAAERREIDAETVLRATVRATDQLAQARIEAGEYRDLVAADRLKWQDVIELGDILTEKVPGRRSPADITLFKSLGMALEDIAFANLVVRRAHERGIGRAMP